MSASRSTWSAARIASLRRVWSTQPFHLLFAFSGHRIESSLVARDQLAKHRRLITVLRTLASQMHQSFSQHDTSCFLLFIVYVTEI
jgi:hypothetical protein